MKRQYKDYAPPRLTIVDFAIERGFEGSNNNGMLGSWTVSGNVDPWGDTPQPNSGNHFGGGWTDAGGDAWQ